jgi:hypothetical protein
MSKYRFRNCRLDKFWNRVDAAFHTSYGIYARKVVE